MKNDQDLFSIGEIAKALGVTRRIILHYEERGLIRPDGRDGATGNRYYTIDTFTQLRSIRSLQNLGLTLDEIRDYFQGSADLTPLIRRLEKMRDELNLNIEKLYERSKVTPAQVKAIALPPQRVYRRVYRSQSVAERTGPAARHGPGGHALPWHGHHPADVFCGVSHRRPGPAAFCVAVPPESQGEFVETLPAFQALCIFHHGAYEELPAVGRRLLDHANARGLTPWAPCATPIWRARPSTRTPASSSPRSSCPSPPRPEESEESEGPEE